MYTMLMSEPYQIDEKDIDTVLGILKRTDPKHATPEKAIEILESLQAGFHSLGHTKPEALAEIQKELEKNKKVKN